MSWLALTPEELVPTGQLATTTKVPAHYLSKVLQSLSTAGLIEGRRGVRGGYRLARDASAITLLEVVRAVTTLDRIRTCPLGLSNHGPNLCPLHKHIDQAAKALIEMYEGVTLRDLAASPSSSKPLCDAQTTASLTVSGRPVRPGTR